MRATPTTVGMPKLGPVHQSKNCSSWGDCQVGPFSSPGYVEQYKVDRSLIQNMFGNKANHEDEVETVQVCKNINNTHVLIQALNFCYFRSFIDEYLLSVIQSNVVCITGCKSRDFDVQ